MGLSADVTDSDDEGFEQSRTTNFRKSRPSTAKHRQDQSPDLSQGLGTTTMRSRDLTALMGRDVYEDDDEEVMAANLGRASPSGTWQPGSKKTPSPKMDTLYGRKALTSTSPKEAGRLESIFGRKTPTREVSPKSNTMSKEDIIFGRKTPDDGKKSPLDRNKSPGDSSMRKLPGMEDRQWQPPNYRSASPGSSEHSRGSRGVTPVDSTLDTITETPRDKVAPRVQRGQKKDSSPRQLALDERPKPQARSRATGGKTPPLVDPHRASPTSTGIKEAGMKHSSPTMDLFGGRSRAAAAQEVEGYMEPKNDQRKYGRLGRSPSPESRKQEGRTTPGKQTSGRFYKDAQKSPIDKGLADRKTPSYDNKIPTSFDRKSPKYFDRKSPTSFDRKSATSFDRKSPANFDRKTPTNLDRKSLKDKKSEAEKTDEDILKQKAAAMKGQSLLDFLTEDGTAVKPEPRGRGRGTLKKDQVDDDIDGIFAANKKLLDSPKSSPRRKVKGRTPALAESIGETIEAPAPTVPKSRDEDASSVCEEIPLDPNKKTTDNSGKEAGSGKQTTERAQADAAIDTIAGVQTMQFIEPAKKVRPVTASAKVQHRPKPRYGTLPGQEQTQTQREFSSTGDIRDAIYEDWYNERIKAAKIKKKEEEKKQKENEEKEKKEKQEKRLESEASYRCWMEKKKEVIHEEESKKKKLQRQKERKEEEEKLDKLKEAEKSYHYWKEKKDQMIKRNLQKKQKEEQQKKEDAEYERRLKNKDRESAFKGWQNRKEKEWKNMARKNKETQKSKKELEKEKEEKLKEKEEEAMDRYYEWMEQKEKQAKQEKKREKLRKMTSEDNYKPAWSPASRTIPFGS